MFTPLINRLNITGKHRYPGPPPGEAIIKAIKESAEKAKKCNILNTPMDELTFTVVDTETTGFCAHEGDEIISLGAVKMVGAQIIAAEKFHRMVNPFRPIPEKITLLTGIDNNMADDEEDIFSALKEMLDFLGITVMVGHALGLDLSFINRKLKYFCKTRVHNIIIDTKNIATAMYPPESATDLDSLLHMHGIEPQGRHTAIGDALLTARLFGIFLELMREKNIVTVKDLYDFLCHGDNTGNSNHRVFFHW